MGKLYQKSFQGWGLLSQFPPFPYFPNLFNIVKLHVSYWISRPYLTGSCGDTRQIWMWFAVCKRQSPKFIFFHNGEINERSFSNPHPRARMQNTSAVTITVTSQEGRVVSNHRSFDRLFNILRRPTSNKYQVRKTGPLWGEFTGDRWISHKRASSTGKVSMSWRHYFTQTTECASSLFTKPHPRRFNHYMCVFFIGVNLICFNSNLLLVCGNQLSVQSYVMFRWLSIF